jgi:hypothetical protein
LGANEILDSFDGSLGQLGGANQTISPSGLFLDVRDDRADRPKLAKQPNIET